MLDMQKSAYDEFNRPRNRFSDWMIQYALIFTLALVGLLSVTYHSVGQQYLSQVQSLQRVHQLNAMAIELSYRWELTAQGDNARSVSDLLAAERALVVGALELEQDTVNLPRTPTLSAFSKDEHWRLASTRIAQVSQMLSSQESRLMQFGVLQNRLFPLLGVGWIALLLYLIWGWSRCVRDQKTALRFFHTQLDRRLSDQPAKPLIAKRRDEFGDFARYLDSVLTSLMHDNNVFKHDVSLRQAALSSSVSIKFLLNQYREIAVMSEGASELWVLESQALSELLDVDEHLDRLEGEVVSETLLSASTLPSIRIGRHTFDVYSQRIGDSKCHGFLVELVPQVAMSELKVLEASLNLMSNDVWNAPIRILDETSAYIGFSQKLEMVRKRVEAFISSANNLLPYDKDDHKVTKLQQLSKALVATLHHSQVQQDERDYLESRLLSELDGSKQNLSRVREQIEQRFELYETYFQQLTEMQLAQGAWVNSVYDGLSNTKQAVLGLLTMVDDHHTVSALEHGIVDLAHDIDTVLEDIVESKPVKNGMQLEHIKGAESELMMRLDVLQEKFEKIAQLTHHDIDNED